MAQYQSFPGLRGDSFTLEKLEALRMPPLAGKSFLDVGCNEGFFCGYALFGGATRVVGLDRSEMFISRARAHFPECELLARGWDALPDARFDVILLASALHYADDQPALVLRLLERLSPGGTLVLELGIASGPENQWVTVQRGPDVRDFPTWSKLEEMLEGWAWKHMGPSVAQRGDPVRRHVVHVTQRRPIAFLLMQPPGFGKSSLARMAFAPAGMTVVSGDALMGRVAAGELEAPEALATAIATDFSAMSIDQAVHRVFAAGLAPALVDLWTREAGARDFAFDGYVPATHHAMIERLLGERGYLPVTLHWERVGRAPVSPKAAAAQAEAYQVWLAQRMGVESAAEERAALPFRGTRGVVEEVRIEGGGLVVRGWALHESGAMPAVLVVRVGDRREVLETYERHLRPDVQKHFALSHALLGFEVVLPVPAGAQETGGAVEVFAGRSEEELVKLRRGGRGQV